MSLERNSDADYSRDVLADQPDTSLTSGSKLFTSGRSVGPIRVAPEKRKLLKEQMKSFCLNTSAHGFLNMFKASNMVVRLIWAVLVVALAGYCTYSKF